jgi:Fe-S-cluster containining protein
MLYHTTLAQTRLRYRALFHSANTLILQKLDALLMQATPCPVCITYAESHSQQEHPLLSPQHEGCTWQTAREEALIFFEVTLAKELLAQLAAIKTAKEQVTCGQTGQCCRLASSEFSWVQLQAKAKQGDAFAKGFTSVFLPYASAEAAVKAFPDVVPQVLAYAVDELSSKAAKAGRPLNDREKAALEPDVYFYHCPYISEDNRCTLYGQPKRPAMCASYPDTPLTFIHKHCAWEGWQETYHQSALTAHASIELGLAWAGWLKQAMLGA